MTDYDDNIFDLDVECALLGTDHDKRVLLRDTESLISELEATLVRLNIIRDEVKSLLEKASDE